ncbi:hypothetical protein KIN20_007056 [Parelaphostrongylus tenuis]|uniref:Uncharacterized protein n=1 Tax=Parelaphostrongylus tenuis TaxID=148309 RepID=A0AAD5M2R7_PARTN|nr:hypothetical protein KIN20_007056 [Parelaphostrongylus tenuis]
MFDRVKTRAAAVLNPFGMLPLSSQTPLRMPVEIPSNTLALHKKQSRPTFTGHQASIVSYQKRFLWSTPRIIKK